MTVTTTHSGHDSARSAQLRLTGYDWKALGLELDSSGGAVMEKLLSPDECAEIAALYTRINIEPTILPKEIEDFARGGRVEVDRQF
jgi:hypothetical protein